MAASGEVVAEMLLRALPAEAAEGILGRVKGEIAGRLRARLASTGTPPTSADVVTALREFFDLLRIAERPAPPPPPPPTDAVEALKLIPADRLHRLLDGESNSAVTLILSCLDVPVVGDILKRLTPERRADIARRLANIGKRNRTILLQLALTVVEKDKALGDLPQELSGEEKLKNVSQILRTLPREDRVQLLQQFDESDSELAENIRINMFQFEDLLKLTDRAVQTILGELDIKSVATALFGAEEKITRKIMSNLSSRVKANLAEESQMLGTPNAARIKDARDQVASVIRREEEAGKIQITE